MTTPKNLWLCQFNNYFSNVFTLEDLDNITDPVIVHAGENTITDIDYAKPEVEAKLKELKPEKAAGSDGFLPKVLKAVADGVVPHLCQRSLTDLWPRQRCPKILGLRTFTPSPKRVSSRTQGTTFPGDK